MKRNIVLVLIILCIAITAFAAGTKITLDSSKDMTPQIDEFIAWYDTLGFLEQAQWDLAFSNLTTGNYVVGDVEGAFSLTGSVQTDARAVYVIPGSEVYHTHTLCRHISGKSNIDTLSMDEALDLGLRLCQTCAKK